MDVLGNDRLFHRMNKPDDTSKSSKSEEAVRKILAGITAAWWARDVDGICKIYEGIGQDFLLFDLYQPFEDVGAARAREKTAAFLSLTEGPVSTEYAFPRFFSSVDLVVVRSRCKFTFKMKSDKDKTQMLCRSTMVFQLLNEAWTCVHQHDSVPNKDVDI